VRIGLTLKISLFADIISIDTQISLWHDGPSMNTSTQHKPTFDDGSEYVGDLFPMNEAEGSSPSQGVATPSNIEEPSSEKSEPCTLISLPSPFSQEVPEPKLSTLALYGPVGSLVKKVAPLTEAHPAPILLQLLIGCGNIIGRGPYFMTNSTEQRTNLYGITVGNSSSARKGSAWEASKRFLAVVDPQWVGKNIKSGLGSGEGVIAVLQDSGDPAVDAIADKRLLLREGEFAQILQAMKRGGNSVSTVIRNGWDNGTFITTTKKPMVATNSHFSMMCDVTREELAYLGKREQTNGFTNRCLWCFSKMPRLLPLAKPIPLNLVEKELNQIKGSVTMAYLLDSVEMTRTAEADEYWCEIYQELVERPDGIWGAVTLRAAAQVVRLSMIYAILDKEFVIGLNHMNAAKALWDYCDQSARWAFEGKTYGEHAQSILMRLQHGEMTQSQLHDLFHRHPNKQVINQALKEISHLIDVVEEKTAGRNKKIIRLKK
jgi:hypothetical protein